MATMPIINRPISFGPYEISAIQRFWRRLTLRPFKQYSLYMIRPDDVPADTVGCDDELVAVNRLTSVGHVSLEVIYNDLLSLHTYNYGDGLINALWGSDLRLMSAHVDGDDIAHIELEGSLAAREVCAVPRIRQQLTEPARQIRSGTGFVRATEVTVNDRSLEDLLRGEV